MNAITIEYETTSPAKGRLSSTTATASHGKYRSVVGCLKWQNRLTRFVEPKAVAARAAAIHASYIQRVLSAGRQVDEIGIGSQIAEADKTIGAG